MTSLGTEPPVLLAIPRRTDDIRKTRALVTAMFMPMSFVAGLIGMNSYVASMECESSLPKDTEFAGISLVMFSTPGTIWLRARRRGWF